MSGKAPSFAERRAAGRARAGGLFAEHADAARMREFFDAVYDGAKGDAAAVPWADLEPHPGLAEWIGRSGHLYEGRALDVGCGLGDNAEALSHLGYKVTAFDYSKTAIVWAEERFPASAVTYIQADLFNAPEEWRGAFDLVHETYTLQALPVDIRREAMSKLAEFVAPGGLLLVICRSRPEGAEVDGPPWPLARGELDFFQALGLNQKNFQEFIVREERDIPHFRIEYEKRKI